MVIFIQDEFYLIGLFLISILLFAIKQKKLFQANGFVTALFSIYLLSIKSFDLFISYYNGYLKEQFIFFERAIGPFALVYIISTITLVMISFLNFTAKYRNRIKFQVFLGLSFFILILIMDYYVYENYTLINLPKIVPFSFSFDLIFYAMGVIIIDAILVNFKILPEFRTKKSDEVLNDTILDKFN